MKPRILLIEDNPLTRKMVTFTLQGKGYDVLEAPDGAAAIRLAAAHSFDLVLQDLILPDVDGFALVRQLRSLAGFEDVPILAFTGFLTQIESAQLEGVGFTDVVTKPAQPSQLLRIIQSHLPDPTRVTTAVAGSNQVVVLADDDPIQRKLTSFRLERMGFKVVSAQDGVEALERIRSARPDVLVTDAMMPRLDGFGLCATIRQDPSLADLRVVMMSNTYIDAEDRDLAARAGADRFVLRTPDLKGLAEALEHVLARPRGNPGASLPDSGDFEKARVHRALRQLETQVTANAGLTQQCALLSAQLSILSTISEAIEREENIEVVLRDTLAACFDAGGVSVGALYLWSADDEPPAVYHVASLQEPGAEDVRAFFGYMPTLRALAQSRQSIALSRNAQLKGTDEWDGLLDRAGLQSVLIVPIVKNEGRFGALVMMSTTVDLADDDHVTFGQAVGNQIGLALRLARTFADKHQSEQQARMQTALLESVIDSVPDGLVVADAMGRYVVWNAAAEGIVRSRPLLAPPRERSALLGLFRPDRVTPFPPDELPLERAMRGEKVNGVEMFMRNEFSPEGVWLRVHARPLKNADGVSGGGVVLMHDITEEKELESQVRQGQKLEAIGQLAGGVAHDFNNLLTAILGYSNFVVETFDADDSRRADMAEVIKAGERAAVLTRQLLTFSRKQVLQPSVLNVNAVVTGIRQMLSRLIGEHIDLVTALAPDLRAVRTDPGQLEQVVMNLVINARDAMPDGGRVAIETANVELDASSAMPHGPVRPGPYVMLSVTDNGVGMSEQTRQRLFEPFFTTKAPGKGTGLGLATVYGIVKQSEGYVRVDSEPGKGTTFKVYLPATATDQALQPLGQRDDVVAAGTETVLIVEDEEAVRFLTRVTLEKAGYQVVDAATPQEAEALFEKNPAFDILVTDVIMPGSSGPRLFEKLAKRRPELKVLYVSGYTDDAIAHHGNLDPGVEFLQKPFTADALARRVREVLDR